MTEADAHSNSIRDEFAHQADSFARSPTMSLAETLGVLVDTSRAGAGAGEMRQVVVKSGGYVVVSDFVTDDDGASAAGRNRSSACATRRTGPC